MQTRPLARVLHSHSVWSWQRLRGMPPLCCSVVWSGYLFEDGWKFRASVWCRGSSRAMNRTLSWKVNLYQIRLNWEGHGVELPRLRWLWLAQEHWWWPSLAHNALFLWASQRWLGWSYNCHFSNRLKSVILWQNLSKGPSINELVLARNIGCHKVCVWLPLNPNIRHSFWHSPQYLFRGSANSISGW